MDHDILRLLDDEEIRNICELLANDLPQSVLGFNFLKMYMKWQQTVTDPVNSDLVQQLDSDRVCRKVYTKRDGNLANCTFVSISGNRDLNIFVFSHDPGELKECIAKTNLINWSKGPAFYGFEGKHYDGMIHVIRTKGLELESDDRSYGYYLPKEEALKFDVDVPNDLTIGSIEAQNYGLINKLWAHSYPESLAYIRCLILLNDNIALYDKGTNEIISWGVIDENFLVAMLHTKKQFHRKGYAALVVKILAKQLAERYDIGTLAFIMTDNRNSEQFAVSLGFQNLNVPGNFVWLKVGKIPTHKM